MLKSLRPSLSIVLALTALAALSPPAAAMAPTPERTAIAAAPSVDSVATIAPTVATLEVSYAFDVATLQDAPTIAPALVGVSALPALMPSAPPLHRVSATAAGLRQRTQDATAHRIKARDRPHG